MSDFWSKRRAGVEAEQQAEELAQKVALKAETEAELAERSDEDLLSELGLPDPDDITDSEQVREFLKAALPQRLKTRALRKLWGLNPILANVDGLVDYGEDFTDAAMCVENMQTVYQVGKGMVQQVLDDLEEDPNAEILVDAEEVPSDAPEEDIAEDDVKVAAAEEIEDAEIPEPYTFSQPDTEEFAEASAPRRMRFSFEATT